MLGGGEEASASFSRHELAQDPLPRESPPLISQVPTYQNLYSFKGLESAPVSSHLPLTCGPLYHTPLALSQSVVQPVLFLTSGTTPFLPCSVPMCFQHCLSFHRKPLLPTPLLYIHHHFCVPHQATCDSLICPQLLCSPYPLILNVCFPIITVQGEAPLMRGSPLAILQQGLVYSGCLLHMHCTRQRRHRGTASLPSRNVW